MRNTLAAESSPYLLQHKDNPIHWQTWNETTIKQAKRLDKPILLSVGYAACHWCHVMAHECFENQAIAELVNHDFVAIKVDREEHPQVDMVYQAALQAMDAPGGWPLTMFLTSEAEPFWGGTYFPLTSKFGRPPFAAVLRAVAKSWRDGKPKIRANVAALRSALRALSNPKAAAQLPDAAVLCEAAESLSASFDMGNGGIGGAPKFPQVPLLEFLWLRRKSHPRSGDFVLLTMEKMCEGGIFDSLGGGFARYSVDEAWLVPHFEKMLYDNGQLLGLLATLYAESGRPLFAETARLLVEWLEAEMQIRGCWAAALDADSKNARGKSEEGAFYVWREEEIDKILGGSGAAAADFKKDWGVSAQGNWEGKNILHRLGKRAIGEEQRRKLLKARNRRPRPGRDDKILADGNGITIAALVSAADKFAEPKWLKLAERGFASLCELLGEGGRLSHCHMGGKSLHRANLDDYAQVIIAACNLFDATAEKPYLRTAEELFAAVKAEHKTAQGYAYADAKSSELLPIRVKPIIDSATASGNAAIIRALRMLASFTGDKAYLEEATAIALALGGSANSYFPSSASFFAAVDNLGDGGNDGLN